jgi:hypothetical protein
MYALILPYDDQPVYIVERECDAHKLALTVNPGLLPDEYEIKPVEFAGYVRVG